MSIPNLVPQSASARFHSTGQGAPVNGNNVFNCGLNRKQVDPDQLVFNITPLGPSVLGASFVSYNPDTGDVTMNFVQTGTDQVVVDLTLEHSIVW